MTDTDRHQGSKCLGAHSERKQSANLQWMTEGRKARSATLLAGSTPTRYKTQTACHVLTIRAFCTLLTSGGVSNVLASSRSQWCSIRLTWKANCSGDKGSR